MVWICIILGAFGLLVVSPVVFLLVARWVDKDNWPV